MSSVTAHRDLTLPFPLASLRVGERGGRIRPPRHWQRLTVVILIT